MHTVLKVKSVYSTGHDRNASLQGNEYVNHFVYNIVYFLLVTDLPHYAS